MIRIWFSTIVFIILFGISANPLHAHQLDITSLAIIESEDLPATDRRIAWTLSTEQYTYIVTEKKSPNVDPSKEHSNHLLQFMKKHISIVSPGGTCLFGDQMELTMQDDVLLTLQTTISCPVLPYRLTIQNSAFMDVYPNQSNVVGYYQEQKATYDWEDELTAYHPETTYPSSPRLVSGHRNPMSQNRHANFSWMFSLLTFLAPLLLFFYLRSRHRKN